MPSSLGAPGRRGREHAQLEPRAGARRTSARGSATAAARSACGRRAAAAASHAHARAASTTARTRVGVLVGGRDPAGRRRERALAEAPRELAVGRERARSPPRARASSPDSHEQAVDAVLDDVRDPAGARADHGAAAQERLDRDAGQALGRRRQQQRPRGVERARDLRRLEAPVPLRALARERPRRPPTCVPLPTTWSRASGTRARREPPRRGEALDVLVALEHADEEQRAARPAPATAGPANAPRSEYVGEDRRRARGPRRGRATR